MKNEKIEECNHFFFHHILYLERMEATHVVPTELYATCKGANQFLNHVNVVYDENGLSFGGMDASHVCLVKVHIGTKSWKHYRLLEGAVQGSFGISLSQLVKVLRYAKGGDTLTVKLAKDDAAFHVTIQGDDRELSVKLPTIEIDEDELMVPDIEYGYRISMLPCIWSTYLDQLASLDPYNLSIFPKTGRKDECVLVAEGDVAPVRMRICSGKSFTEDEPMSARKDKARFTRIEEAKRGDYEVSMSFRLVSQMTMIGRAMSTVEINMEQNVPILFRFTNHNHIRADIHLAPKIMDDEYD